MMNPAIRKYKVTSENIMNPIAFMYLDALLIALPYNAFVTGRVVAKPRF